MRRADAGAACRDSAAFTVVEVAIAIMVLLVAVVVTASMLPTGHQQRANQDNWHTHQDQCHRQAKANGIAHLKLPEAADGLPDERGAGVVGRGTP